MAPAVSVYLALAMANERIQPRLPPIMHAYLDALADIGAYGKDKSDVARTFIEEGIRKALGEGVISPLKASDFSKGD